jgi:signal peptidase
MNRTRRLIGRSVAVISMASIGAVIILARPSELLVVVILIVAMAWGAIPQAIDAFIGKWQRPPRCAPGHAPVTIVVHVDGEPVAISRAGIAAAAASAPTVVVATDAHAIELLGPLPVPVLIDSTVAQALNRAATMIDTDAFLVLSARSFPDVQAAESAAALIREGAGWIIGHTRTFSHDGFAPLVRERLGNRLRSSARLAGLIVWEPDATVVSTRLVREHPFEPGRPWGSMLRSAAGRGMSGSHVDLMMAMTAAPVDSHSYWSASVLWRRGAAADLADALSTERGRPRWLAMGLLSRELDGCQLALWLLMPWLMTRSGVAAFRSPTWTIVTLAVVPALLRWTAVRHAHGVRGHPLDDLMALAFDAPCSVLALGSAFTRRVTPTRLALPRQPLLLAGLAFATITLAPLFADGPTSRRGPAVGLALTELGLLWLLAMRVVFQRNWARTTYRIRTSLPVRVGGTSVTTLDVSPTGLALEGSVIGLPVGWEVPIDVSLDDGSTLRASAAVADRRRWHDLDITGVALRVPPSEWARWAAQLSRSAAIVTSGRPTEMRAVHATTVRRRKLPARLLAGASLALIIVITLVAGAALFLTAIGYRPLIVHSGSMMPALQVGDIVLVEDIPARQLAVGDIATLRDPTATNDTLTHRVRAVTNDGVILTVTTRGDANASNETFTLEPDELVGRVIWRLPKIGAGIAWAGSGRTRRGAFAAGVAACLLPFVLSRLRIDREVGSTRR